eukprot:352884-Chlamydomonas_euryale.AAC.2
MGGLRAAGGVHCAHARRRLAGRRAGSVVAVHGAIAWVALVVDCLFFSIRRVTHTSIGVWGNVGDVHDFCKGSVASVAGFYRGA